MKVNKVVSVRSVVASLTVTASNARVPLLPATTNCLYFSLVAEPQSDRAELRLLTSWIDCIVIVAVSTPSRIVLEPTIIYARTEREYILL